MAAGNQHQSELPINPPAVMPTHYRCLSISERSNKLCNNMLVSIISQLSNNDVLMILLSKVPRSILALLLILWSLIL